MFSAEYTNTTSLLAAFDPRLKVVILFIISIVLALLKTYPSLLLALFMSIMILTLAAVPFNQIIKRLIPVNTMILFLWCILPFSTKGEPVWTYGDITITYSGLVLTSMLTLKANAMMLFFIAFVVSTPINTSGHAMHMLGVPGKLVHLFFFTYRYIHVIYSEYLRLRQAMTIRGFVAGTNLHTYRSYAYLLGMLLVKSADRAKRVHNAMLCRGFNGRFYSMTTFKIKPLDIVVFILMLIIIILLGVIEWAPKYLLLN